MAFSLMPAHADDIVQVTISNLVFSGNDACGPSGVTLCSEVLNASYQWDNSTNSYIAGSLSFNATGVLGSSLPFVNPAFLVTGNGPNPEVFVQFGDASNDLFNIVLTETNDALTAGTYPEVATMAFAGGVPAGSYTAFLLCNFTAPTSADTCNTPDYPVLFTGPYSGAFNSSGTVSISEVPEPATITNLGTGLLCLLLVTLLRQKQIA
jgi:hypothetical protein